MRQGMLDQVESSGHIDGERAAPLIVREILDRRAVAVNRIVDEYVDRTMGLGGGVDERLDLLGFGQIGAVIADADAVFFSSPLRCASITASSANPLSMISQPFSASLSAKA